MMMPRYRESALTGRARVRPGWFGRQILQVEVGTLTYSSCPPMPGRDPKVWLELMRAEGTVSHHWRDAEWFDMQTLETFTIGQRARQAPPRPLPAPAPPPNAAPQKKRAAKR